MGCTSGVLEADIILGVAYDEDYCRSPVPRPGGE
jgi:hypothetical protein